MRLVILGVVVTVGLARIATGATVSGVVVDASGKPIEGARIDHVGKLVVVGPPSQPSSGESTNADGAFEVKTTSPAIVIRKPGFESQRIRINGDAQLRITLRAFRGFPECEVKIPHIKTKNGSDVDYKGTWTYIDTKSGPKGVIRGEGPTYSWGAPNDSDVWYSREYLEVMYDDGVVDARGHIGEDNYWRSQTIFGAAAQYYKMDRATAEILDCVMDRNRLKSP